MSDGSDRLIVDVLPDGSIRVSADEVSDANHMNAERFLRFLAEEMGGPVSRVKKRHVHAHEHEHDRQKLRN